MKKFTQKQLNSLNINVRAFYDYQRERITLDGRLGQRKDGIIKKKAPPRDPVLLMCLQNRRKEVWEFEKALEKEITEMICEHPLWLSFLSDVKGCGPIISAVIISQFDIYKAPMVSNMVSFAGLAPGKDRKVKGKKRPYNQFLKDKLCKVLGGSFLKCKSSHYSHYYYQYKTRLENSNRLVEERLRIKDRSKKKYKSMGTRLVKWKHAYPGHRHDASVRKMIREFLKDLYNAWREIEGLPVREPYEKEYLGKVHGGHHVVKLRARKRLSANNGNGRRARSITEKRVMEELIIIRKEVPRIRERLQVFEKHIGRYMI